MFGTMAQATLSIAKDYDIEPECLEGVGCTSNLCIRSIRRFRLGKWCATSSVSGTKLCFEENWLSKNVLERDFLALWLLGVVRGKRTGRLSNSSSRARQTERETSSVRSFLMSCVLVTGILN